MSTAFHRTRPARRHRLLAVLVIAAALFPGVLPGQQPDTPKLTLVAGVGLTSPLMVDGNGTTVRFAPAPTISVHLTPERWRVGPVRGGINARVASASLRLRDGRERWSGGQMWQSDLLATATLALPGGVARVTAGGGVVWLRSIRSISPLEHAVISPAAEATLSLRPTSAGWGMAITAQGYRLRPSVGRPGGVGRLVAGVTHEF